MQLEVLISCMFQDCSKLIKQSNIQTNVLIINQCNEEGYEEFYFTNKKSATCLARIYHTTERGLSRSRNMAIAKAQGDICLLCDDDETFCDCYEEDIINTFTHHPNTDIIAFRLTRSTKEDGNKSFRINYFTSPKISSIQIAFLRKSCLNVRFDEMMGSGTGNGGGEENKFLLDCLNSGLKALYIPVLIGSVTPTQSQWFQGYSPKYMRDKGWAIRRTYGFFWGACYLLYFTLSKHKKYREKMSLLTTITALYKGYFEKRNNTSEHNE